MKGKLKSDTENQIQIKEEMNLILWNDEINNYEFVIQSIVDICKLSDVVALDITLDCHCLGCCKIISGSLVTLLEMQEKFLIRNITTTIE